MENKIEFLTRRLYSLEEALWHLKINRDAFEHSRSDADIRRLGERSEVCRLKVQELRAEILERIEEMEGVS